jgi:LacI family transcriptional regulator
LLEQNVDGVILVGKIGTPWIEYVRNQNLPMVLVDYDVPRFRLSTVAMDNREGARLVVEHLIERGHTRIGFIGGDLDHPSIAERYTSYCDTLLEHGITPHGAWKQIDEPDTRVENGYQAARQLLSRHGQHPSAVFAANDAMALGCLQYCRKAGIAAPGALALAGFDNIEAGLHVEPRLTTVNVECEEMGAAAVRRLVELMRKSGSTIVKATTPVELVVRESSGMYLNPTQ